MKHILCREAWIPFHRLLNDVCKDKNLSIFSASFSKHCLLFSKVFVDFLGTFFSDAWFYPKYLLLFARSFQEEDYITKKWKSIDNLKENLRHGCILFQMKGQYSIKGID